METKICSKCGINKELCFFQKDKSKEMVIDQIVKFCRKLYNDSNYHRFVEKISEYKKTDRKNNQKNLQKGKKNID